MNQTDTKVFCIGLNKTGTTSIGKALEILGFHKRKSYDSDLVKHWSQNNFEPILQAAKEHNNLEDWPWPLVYQRMAKEFPEAKFILTKRNSAEDWYYSLCKHMQRTGFSETSKLVYGHYMPHDFKEEYIHFYQSHNKAVTSFFKGKNNQNLLVLNVTAEKSWESLCEFLNLPLPDADFPHLNKATDILHIDKKDYRIRKLLRDKIYIQYQKLKQLFNG